MATEQTSIRFDPATRRQIDQLKAAGWGTITNIVATAIDRMYQQETKTMKTYTNISERYGEQVSTTIGDYQELNPDGQFEEIGEEIRELLSDKPGDYEIVAEQPTT